MIRNDMRREPSTEGGAESVDDRREEGAGISVDLFGDAMNLHLFAEHRNRSIVIEIVTDGPRFLHCRARCGGVYLGMSGISWSARDRSRSEQLVVAFRVTNR